jgi:DNA-directed RNA polymerase specialized sigma24 family protein
MDYSNYEIRQAIDEWVHSERDRRIMVDRLINGYTYEKLAEIYDLSVRQIKNIVYREEDKLFKKLK